MAFESHPRPCLPIRSVSVLMPTWQGMEFLDRVLDALSQQEMTLRWDVHVIDSGSTDGTVETLLKRAGSFPVPFRVYTIASPEFDHGDTRNQLAARSRGDLLVFLTQDAIPSSPTWLATLAANFENPLVGGATCRNVAREDARVLTGVFSRIDPGYGETRIERTMPSTEEFEMLTSDERRLLYNFNDVASAVRRELWDYHPFPRTMMGEDVLMGRGLIHAGYTVVHDIEATVDHSHDYGPEKMQWRGFVDGKFSAEWLDRVCVETEQDINPLAERLVDADTAHLIGMGFSGEELENLKGEALVLRTAIVRGLYEGGCSALRYPASAMRERRKLRLLFIDADEQLRAIGKALGRRGHEVHFMNLVVPVDRNRAPRWTRKPGAYWTTWEVVDVFQIMYAMPGWLAATPVDVCHFGSVMSLTASAVLAAREAGCATVCQWLEGHERSTRAQMLCDLRVTSDLELRKRVLSEWDDGDGILDPQLFAFIEDPGGEHQKSFVDAVADAEFRYRGLSAICTEGSEGDLERFEVAGAAAKVEGESTVQGADWLLMKPGSSAVFTLPTFQKGRYEITLEQIQLGGETEVTLGGEMGVEGLFSCKIEGEEALQDDRVLETKFSLALASVNHSLWIKPAEGAFLRVGRVKIERVGDSLAHGLPAAASLPALVEELRVVPGPAVETSSLPKVAVVIPHLQDVPQLMAALRSIAEQDYPQEQLEIVIVDNSGELRCSEPFSGIDAERIRVVTQTENLGFAAACNLGAREASRAEVLVFVNDDMAFDRGFLRELVSPLVRGECACATARLFDAAGEVIDTSGTGTTLLGICVQPGFGEPSQNWQEVSRKTLFGCGGAMAIDASVFHEMRGFDENYFAYYEDLDLGWRMWLAGFEVHYVPTAIGRHHHSSTSKKMPPEQVRLIMVRNSLYTVIKNYDDENLQRILPSMLALATRRAFLKTGLETSAFRIEQGALADQHAPGAKVEIDRIGAADLVAIDDLLSNWDYWMEQRREVQSRRVRTDEEIQRMFLQPLACVEGDPAYAALQQSLTSIFGLEKLFERR